MNRKGFMMAELVVVSSIIVITLTGLYISYNKIITSYRQIISYYDIGFYYKLGYYNMKLDKSGTLNSTLDSIDDGKYLDITSKVVNSETGLREKIYIVKNLDGVKVLKDALKDAGENQTYQEYLEYLKSSKDIINEYYIIGEQCKSDKTKCVYAYAEVAK